MTLRPYQKEALNAVKVDLKQSGASLVGKYKRTKKIREKMRKAQSGKKLSLESRIKISKSLIGNKYSLGYKQSIKTREKKRLAGIGRHPSIETRKKLSIAKKGENHHNWQGGISKINDRIRQSLEYKLWRESVFKRDNYTCIWCNQKGGKLNADHIKSFAFFPELRFAIDNGRTLCVPCHKTTKTYGNRIA